MADITDVVVANITIEDASPATPNFGRILVLGHSIDATAGALELFPTSNAGLTALEDAGHDSVKGSAVRKIAGRIASQKPKCVDFLVYNQAAKINKTVELTVVNVAAGRSWSVDVNDVNCTIDYATTTLDSASEIATALAALIAAVDGVDATANAAVITVTAASGFSSFGLANWDTDRLEYEDVTGDDNVEVTLGNILDQDTNGFYGVVIEHQDAVNLAAAAQWCEENGKLLLYTTSDTANLTAASGIGDTLKDAGYNYSVGMFSGAKDDQYSCAGLASRQFSRNPGSSTWALKAITGVTVDTLSPTQLANLRTNRLMPYTLTRGRPFTLDGWAASGRFIDLTHFADWLQGEIETGVLTVFLNNESVQQTDKGIGLVEGAVRAALMLGVRRGGIRDDFEVFVPKLTELSGSDRAQRKLKGITFSANGTGAFHYAEIDGSISTTT